MKTAYIFPGQGAQHVGMGKDLYESSPKARDYFERANDILGYRISDIMFEGSEDELRKTQIAQPAIFTHTVATSRCMEGFAPDMVAGHSLGEFAALTAAGCLSFEDGLRLINIRAKAMQKACEMVPSTMAAVIGANSSIVDMVCGEVSKEDDLFVQIANYNAPKNLVISGHVQAVTEACNILKGYGAKCLPLRVSGAFHSPLMEPAVKEVEEAIHDTIFLDPVCPVYQNVDFMPHLNPEVIKENLISQLTSPVLWMQEIANMVRDGAGKFIEIGPDSTLLGIVDGILKDIREKDTPVL